MYFISNEAVNSAGKHVGERLNLQTSRAGTSWGTCTLYCPDKTWVEPISDNDLTSSSTVLTNDSEKYRGLKHGHTIPNLNIYF